MKTDIRVMYAIRGLLTIICGLTILLLPSPTIYSLATVFAAYCLLEAVVTLLPSLKKVEKNDPRWYLIGESAVNGSAGVLILMFVGILGFIFPGVTSILLLLLISGKIILIGLIELLVVVVRKKAGALFRVPISLTSIILGLVMIYLQDRGILSFVLPLGALGIVIGSLLILVCFRRTDSAPPQ
jgi:uncharacterized membrane protein HdeD (DUF308 family)